MPVTSATSSPVLANFSNSTTSVARTPTQTLGENDFLKLLAVQLQQQDPMKPMDDTAFIAQTAQFTSLQQMSQLNQQQQMLTGSSYIGRNVTVQNTDGTEVTGLVTALDNSGTTPAVVINGTSYTLDMVKRIEPVAVPATSAATSGTADPTTGLSGTTVSGGPSPAPAPTSSTNTVPTSSPTQG
jgi:flagellar basal-body rod modification protein FlgD